MEPKNSSLKAALKKTAKRVLTEHQQGNLVSLLQLGRHRELREELHRRLAAPDGGAGRIFLCFTPTHGNVGDQAIALAEADFLAEHFPGRPVIEVPDLLIVGDFGALRRHISPRDLLLIHGGGFLGSLWPHGELCTQKILAALPEQPTIILPQSVYFDAGEKGDHLLKKAQAVYRRTGDLTLCARERSSYDFARQHLLGGSFTRCLLVPDLVLSLRRLPARPRPEGGLCCCLRTDMEKTSPAGLGPRLQALARECGREFFSADMVEDHSILPAERAAAVEEKFLQLGRAELVVTDRLHCMIFCALMGIPCIALDNRSHKVHGVWMQWLSGREGIFPARTQQEALEQARRWLAAPEPAAPLDPGALDEAFAPLREAIAARLK